MRRMGGGADGFLGSGAPLTRRVLFVLTLAPNGSVAPEPLPVLALPEDSPVVSPLWPNHDNARPKRVNEDGLRGGRRVLRYMLNGRRARFACGTNRFAATIRSAYIPEAKKRKSVVQHMMSRPCCVYCSSVCWREGAKCQSSSFDGANLAAAHLGRDQQDLIREKNNCCAQQNQ